VGRGPCGGEPHYQKGRVRSPKGILRTPNGDGGVSQKGVDLRENCSLWKGWGGGKVRKKKSKEGGEKVRGFSLERGTSTRCPQEEYPPLRGVLDGGEIKRGKNRMGVKRPS